ncbi:glucose PTS transporter subunit IIA [Lachnospiraceae bacterium 54-53]
MGFQKQKKDHIFSPVKGKYVHLKDVADPTFSSGVLGAGFGVEPDADVILAPVEGTVSMVFPTGHAIGFPTDNGLEVLVHIGIDTVGLDGNGFEILKKQGERVMAHEKVIRFNRELIKKQGLDPTVMVVLTNGGEYEVKLISGEQVTEESELAVAEVKEEELKEMKEPSKYEYGKMCSEILEAVGGSKNIKNVFHCITRLRIVPVNRKLVDMDKLNHASGLNTLASCVTPGLYAIVAGGMIKGIISLITALGLVSSKSDIIVVLNAVGDAPFYFMPFIIGYAAAKRFKVKEIFGIMTAGILMYSTFLSPAEGITGYQFGLFAIPAYNYKGFIFSVILSVWIFSLIFHFIDKRMPKNLRIVFSGALSFLIAAPLFLGFAAPLGNWIAKGMTGGFAWLFNNVGPFAGALFCGIIPLTIIFGIKGWSAVELQNLSTLGYDYMLPNFFCSNLAVSGAVLAYALKMKAGEQKSAAISTGLVCILGITEPALYGIALPEKKPLFAAMAGGAIAGAVAVLLGVVTYAFF